MFDGFNLIKKYENIFTKPNPNRKIDENYIKKDQRKPHITYYCTTIKSKIRHRGDVWHAQKQHILYNRTAFL